MSTPQTAPLVELPPMGNLTPEQTSLKSLTHWVWTPYRDINNMQAWGIKSLLGYRGQAWTRFERCKPYPLGNMTQFEKDRQAAEDAFQSSFSINSNSIPDVEYVKYAQDQANELGESFADEQGLRILVSLIGMDDAELVIQIVQCVQPFAYKIHEMAYEFTAGASKRIEKSNLSAKDKDKATALAKIMLNGSRQAEAKAEAEYEILISSMSEASVGKPGISNPNEFHRWICDQLNKPVPERVNRMAQSGGTDSATIKVLMDRDAAREKEMAELRTKVEGKRKAKEA